MYENETYDKIMSDKISEVKNIDANLDTRKGSVIYVTLSPDSIEESMIYIALDKILKETFADTSSREYLIRRCFDRNITPLPATNTIITGTFTYNDVNNTPQILSGTTFTANNYTWEITSKIDDYNYKLTCTTTGEQPNSTQIGTKLVPVSSIPNLASASISEISIYGEDEESTEDLRDRYFNSFKDYAYRFNRSQTIQLVSEQQGVGGVKPFRASIVDGNGEPESNHPGHIAVFITDSEYGLPTQDLINTVQTIIDPTQNQGDGIGLAGIDQEVHIASAKETTINISSNFSFISGTFADYKSYIEAEIISYIKSINEQWGISDTPLVIRISQIESRLITNLSSYIEDISGTTINGNTSNLTLGNVSLAVFGEVTEL